MPLIVEDGTGLVDAESLTSVEFADTFHANRGNSAWAAFDVETKEQLLRKATDYFEAMYGQVLDSVRFSLTQALSFPRIAWMAVPATIQQAIAELALIAATTPLMPVIKRGKKSVKVGPISVQYDGNSATSNKFIAASMRVAPFLNKYATGFNAKLIRV